jgi:hypothetical protein
VKTSFEEAARLIEAVVPMDNPVPALRALLGEAWAGTT